MDRQGLLFVLLPLLFHRSVHGLIQESYNNIPFDTCSIKEKSCEIHEENLISSVSVPDVDECRQFCVHLENCQYFSYLGPNNYPLKNYCLLFSSCQVLENCNDCHTEDKLCKGQKISEGNCGVLKYSCEKITTT